MCVCIWELGLAKTVARGEKREARDRVTLLFQPFQLKSIYYVLSKFIIFLPSHIVCILQIRHNFQMSMGEARRRWVRGTPHSGGMDYMETYNIHNNIRICMYDDVVNGDVDVER